MVASVQSQRVIKVQKYLSTEVLIHLISIPNIYIYIKAHKDSKVISMLEKCT